MKTNKSSRHGEESDNGGMVGRGIVVLELGDNFLLVVRGSLAKKLTFKLRLKS